MNSETLFSRFQTQQVSADEFNHLAHLKVAWYYICRKSITDAREKFHKDLIELTSALGAEEKYHRTLTDFFLDYLYQVKWYFNTESWAVVEEKCPLLIHDAKKLVSYYYSDKVIESDLARTGYVAADLMPLDRASLVLTDKAIPVYDFVDHDSPVIVSMPHHGQFMPHDVLRQMTPAALNSADTDWYLVQLYDFLDALGVSRMNANYSRYLIDLNRDSSGKVLYKGADNTELCPTSTFDTEPLYGDGKEPDSTEVKRRTELYWKPYHDKLQQLIEHTKAKFGYCLLFEAHTIQSRVPRFFEGQLPDFNFGTNEGKTVEHELSSLLQNFDTHGYSKIINGRFKGGYITRQYADPDNNIYTVQLELSQATYLKEKERFYDHEKAADVTKVLQSLLAQLVQFMDKEK
ncbi:N-formylglutamate deformylase [Kangiella shandongensis]|uniref:N-formylglutamate deformylase n=1 Tax=Kangiella shandongensis TaxID=2763258 RepID=UPI001CBE612A|nr:N-formylglutamate deformylase [Kangiella shandongensis]